MTRSTRHLGSLFAALALIWGLSFVAIKTGLETVPPVLLAAVRHDIAAVVLLGYALWQGRTLRPRTRDDWSLILIGGIVLIGAHFALLFLGQQYVPSSFGAILLSLTPVVTPAFASTLLPSYRVRPHELIGTVCGFVGVVIIANPTPGSVGGRLLGVALLIGSAVAFAVGAVLTERFTSSLPLVSLQAWMTLLGAAILHAVSAGLPSERLGTVSVGLEQVAAVAYLGIVASAVGFLLYFRLVSTVGAAETSLVSYAVPAVTAVSGWLLLGETLGPVTVAGFAVIVVGFAWVKADVLRSLRRRHAGSRSYHCGPQDDCVVVSGNAYATRE
ncbi:DMT family transporter [Haloarcula brevis]|uniref:DMT family transporter n=1 Tax=Haloarcula brevis TaxID=3111453 RepID=UPI00300F08DB